MIRHTDGTSFEVSAVDVRERDVNVAWTLKGKEHVAYVHWIEDRWLVGGSEAFVDPSTVEMDKDDTPQQPGSQSLVSPFVANDQGSSEYPYAWIQTHDSVTITFNLTFDIQNSKSFDPNRDLLCIINADNLSLRFPDHGTLPLFTPSQKTFFSRTQWDWWDSVLSSRGESTWTFEWTDREAGKATLQLEIGKRNPGVRWTSVFAPQGDLEVEVPETLTPGQVAETADRMAKWTDESGAAQLFPRDDEEDDFEFDDDPAFSGSVAVDANDGAKVGSRLLFTTITPDGAVTPSGETAWALSTELGGPSIILKSHVDGHLFSPTPDGWRHTSTAPALSFVLASKRDTQRVHHLSTLSGAVVVAFESARPDGTGGNAYVYWPVEETRERTKSGKSGATGARQAVVKAVRGDEVGMLMGVAKVIVAGKTVVVGLCERGWVLLEGL